ncbi:MAG: hypothetical protein IIC72_05045 [Acidobacteria bacterium]|nr:hypothetical protein [Acidobacteriota bacterium]
MSNESSPPIVTQLRLVVEVDDFDEAVWFYRDVLGLKTDPEKMAEWLREGSLEFD